MKCLILAAGYATRMYPLTENFPKPLLPVGSKPLLEHLLEDLENTKKIEEYLIVTNHRFLSAFKKWKGSLPYGGKIKLFDDGSTENENRLGAVRDIWYVVEHANIKDDLLVLAGDNLLDFSLLGFIQEFEKRHRSMVMCHEERRIEKLRKTGVAELSEEGLVLTMEEKPEEPKGHFAIPPFYIFRKEDLAYIGDGIREGCSTDSPGGFLVWFCRRACVYAMIMQGKRYDVGSIESYREICEHWTK